MAGFVLCHPSVPDPTGGAPVAGAGRALDCPTRRFFWAAPPRPTGDGNVVAGLSTFNGPHQNVSYYAAQAAYTAQTILNEKMCPTHSTWWRGITNPKWSFSPAEISWFRPLWWAWKGETPKV